MEKKKLTEASELILKSRHSTGFTGAGISVESGILPFRGKNGLWNKYDPGILDLDYFYSNPLESWKVIKEIFYDFFVSVKPNDGHKALAELEKLGLLNAVITQNIDNLHQETGSETVYEFHGNSRDLICQHCSETYPVTEELIKELPPRCDKCNGVLKPDFIFFGEMIPEYAYIKSVEEASKADVFVIVGSTGEVVPASMIPPMAKENGAKIIEVNPNESQFTQSITDIFLQGKAEDVLPTLVEVTKSKLQ
ncbi:MAG: NAD-dependent deacylase [Bacteroidales bacterium]